jgi:hypothetical protein
LKGLNEMILQAMAILMLAILGATHKLSGNEVETAIYLSAAVLGVIINARDFGKESSKGKQR